MITGDQDMSCSVSQCNRVFRSSGSNAALLGERFVMPRSLCILVHTWRQRHLVLWNVMNWSPCGAATHSRRPESSNYVNIFFQGMNISSKNLARLDKHMTATSYWNHPFTRILTYCFMATFSLDGRTAKESAMRKFWVIPCSVSSAHTKYHP